MFCSSKPTHENMHHVNIAYGKCTDVFFTYSKRLRIRQGKRQVGKLNQVDKSGPRTCYYSYGH